MTVVLFWLGFGTGYSYAAYLCTCRTNYRLAAFGFGAAAVTALLL